MGLREHVARSSILQARASSRAQRTICASRFLAHLLILDYRPIFSTGERTMGYNGTGYHRLDVLETLTTCLSYTPPTPRVTSRRKLQLLPTYIQDNLTYSLYTSITLQYPTNNAARRQPANNMASRQTDSSSGNNNDKTTTTTVVSVSVSIIHNTAAVSIHNTQAMALQR
ncbi:hypothetical protein B0H12DRAFT_342319 [Mycena haematopus]|nr:hypothetical protein B0H12DRAFT_342319 [Mycena haematopus]